jgi:hypothetical protein
LDIAWDDPQRAEQDLIAATESCPHPEPFRALLKFYRLRNTPNETRLKTAYRYYQLTGAKDDPLQTEAVKECFVEEVFARRHPVPLDFIHAVWQAAPPPDDQTGIRLASMLFRDRRAGHAVNVIFEILDSSKPSPGVVAACLGLLRAADQPALAHEVLNTFKAAYAGDESFGREWIRLVTKTRDSQSAAEIAELVPLQAQAPSEYLADLYLLLGERDHAEEVMSKYVASPDFVRHARARLSGRMGPELRRVLEELGMDEPTIMERAAMTRRE